MHTPHTLHCQPPQAAEVTDKSQDPPHTSQKQSKFPEYRTNRNIDHVVQNIRHVRVYRHEMEVYETLQCEHNGGLKLAWSQVSLHANEAVLEKTLF